MYSSSSTRVESSTESRSGVAAWDPADLREAERHVEDDTPRESTAEAEARQHRQELDAAFAEGYETGRAEGVAAESGRVADAMAALETAAAAIRENTQRWTRALEANICALAVTAAREIVGRELRTDEGAVADLVRRALDHFPVDARVRVRLNPRDLSLLSLPKTSAGQPVQVAAGREVDWHPDPNVSPGGCMVEGPDQIVDGRVEKALERIYTALVYG